MSKKRFWKWFSQHQKKKKKRLFYLNKKNICLANISLAISIFNVFFFYLISFPHVLASCSVGRCGRVFLASGKFYYLKGDFSCHGFCYGCGKLGHDEKDRFRPSTRSNSINMTLNFGPSLVDQRVRRKLFALLNNKKTICKTTLIFRQITWLWWRRRLPTTSVW